MHTLSMQIDPWLKTVGLLNALSSIPFPDCDAERADLRIVDVTKAGRLGVASFRAATAKVIDRISPRRVTISWHDPTMCNYMAQIWQLGVANHTSHCVLTQAPIRRGDPIYRPRRGLSKPMNASAMILAKEIDEVMPHANED